MDGHLKYGLLMGLYSSALLAMPITVLANTDMQNATDLPQIVSWDDGHGYLESGEMLRNGWGYDTVNPAGKYVLFDEEGAILRRSESMEAELEDNYIGTEQVPAVIVFRARVFDGFAGTIEVALEEQNGVTQTVWVFLWKMGIEIFQSQKPDLGNGFEKSGKKAVYYGSLEYKESAEAIKGSRACGVLLTGDTAYVVYNTMAKRMKWAQKMEMAMRTWTERMLLIGGGLRQADSLILGNTMDFLLELLNSDGGVRKNLYQVDDVYEHYYYIPRTDNAKVQMELLLTSWKREKIKNLLATLVKYPRRKQYALSEGFDKDMQLIYFCHELDMRHLCRIKQEIGWKQKGTIICLDYQANVLRAYFGEGVRVRELNTDKIMEYLTKGRDE